MMIPQGKLRCEKCGQVFDANEIKVRTDFVQIEAESKRLSFDVTLICPHCDMEQELDRQYVALPQGYDYVER
jgi:rubredoxin